MYIRIFLLLLLLLNSCTSTVKPYRRVSADGLHIDNKKLYVIVYEPKVAFLTEGFDSLYAAKLKEVHQESEVYYNEHLDLSPVSLDSLFAKCGDNYLLKTFVSSVQAIGTETVVSKSSLQGADYSSLMYRCPDKKVVWKMEYSYNVGFRTTPHDVIDTIFADFKNTGILK